MGKQLRFCIHPNDEDSFLDYLASKSTLRIIKGLSEDQNMIQDIWAVKQYSSFEYLYIMDTTLGIEPSFIELIEKKDFDISTGKYINNGQFYYRLLNVSEGPLIEYDRSFINKIGLLKDGRIWAEMKYYSCGQYVMKDEKFMNLYIDIANWLKKNLQYNPEYKIYLSAKAVDWYANAS